jgi:DNA-binding NtrC family response regulator
MATILLVDDQPDVLAANRAALEEHGHRVAIARTTDETSAVLKGPLPDAIVLEAMIEGGGGDLDFARRIAAELPDVPLILLTRADDVLDRATRRRQDRDGWIAAARFMEKPVAPETIAEEVDHVLQERAAAPPRAAEARE